MKLYLHNLMGRDGGPLKIIPTEVKCTPTEFQRDAIARLAKQIDFPRLACACADVGLSFSPPSNIDSLTDEDLIQTHRALFEVEVVSGELVSPSGQRFPIVCGIPDMSNWNR